MNRIAAVAVSLAILTATAAAQNRANDYLLSVGETVRATALARAIGEGCVGVKPFYMGIGKTGINENKAFWSLLCADGRSFSVQVNPDGNGTVLTCGALEAMGGGPCFRRFD